MPKINGLEATSIILNDLNPKIKTKIVGCTAYKDNRITAQCIQAGMRFVFFKPLRLE